MPEAQMFWLWKTCVDASGFELFGFCPNILIHT